MPWYFIVQAILKGFGMYANHKLNKYALELAKQTKELQLQSAENARSAGRVDQMLYEGDALMAQMEADASALTYEKQANDTEQEGVEFAASQRLAFVKNGVDLFGSPLLISQKTIADSEAEAADLRALAESTKKMGGMQATSLRTKGRAAMLGAEINASSITAAAEMDYTLAEFKAMASEINSQLGNASDMTSSFGRYSSQNIRTSNSTHTSPYSGQSIRNELSNTDVKLSGSKARSLQGMYSGSGNNSGGGDIGIEASAVERS